MSLGQDGVNAMRHAQYSGNAPIRCSGGAARSRSDQWVALHSRLPTHWRCVVQLGAPPEAEPGDASGGAWRRLATPGSDWGALGSAWGGPWSVWGAPRSARGRLGAPGQRLGAPGNASGTPGNASGRLDAPGDACGALGSALGFAFSTVWQRLGSAEERLERLGGRQAAPAAWERPEAFGNSCSRCGSTCAAPGSAWGTPRTRMGAPRERLVTPWSDWAAPGSAQELLGVLGAPRSAWQRLATPASGFCFAALTSAWSAWGRLAAGAPPGLRLGRACAAPGGHLGSASESLGSAWGAPGTPNARRRARGGIF